MPKVTVYNLLLDMIKYEENFGAYWIYLALKKGYLQKEDEPKRIYDVPFTDEEIAEIKAMNKRDVLGINRIKLYATSSSECKRLICKYIFELNTNSAMYTWLCTPCSLCA